MSWRDSRGECDVCVPSKQKPRGANGGYSMQCDFIQCNSANGKSSPFPRNLLLVYISPVIQEAAVLCMRSCYPSFAVPQSVKQKAMYLEEEEVSEARSLLAKAQIDKAHDSEKGESSSCEEGGWNNKDGDSCMAAS